MHVVLIWMSRDQTTKDLDVEEIVVDKADKVEDDSIPGVEMTAKLQC